MFVPCTNFKHFCTEDHVVGILQVRHFNRHCFTCYNQAACACALFPSPRLSKSRGSVSINQTFCASEWIRETPFQTTDSHEFLAMRAVAYWVDFFQITHLGILIHNYNSSITTTTTTTMFIRAQKLYSVNINARKKNY